MTSTEGATLVRRNTTWTAVCHADELEPMWGEAALVGGSLVGVVLLPDGSVRAFSNTDPRTGASVMARGSSAPAPGLRPSRLRCTRTSSTSSPAPARPTRRCACRFGGCG